MASNASPSARAGGYTTGRQTKATIVARAAEAFAHGGFNGASLRAIARAADVDHSTLIHHFGTKTALLLAVLEWHDAQHAPPTLPGRFTAAELAEGLTFAAEHNRSAPGLVRLLTMLTAEASAEDHPARPVLQERHRALRGILAPVIQEQRDAGILSDDDLPADQVAASLIAAWDGLQAYEALHPGEIDVPTLLARILRRELGLDYSLTSPST